jgi:GNAT superfamily N-acetyltransferase
VSGLVATVFAPFRDRFAPTAMRWSADAVARTAADWLLAETADGALVGAVHHLVDPEGYTFDAMSVHPLRRRAGVGRALYAALESGARQAKAHQVIIAIRDELAANASFVSALGFARDRPHGTAHHVWIKPLEATP